MEFRLPRPASTRWPRGSAPGPAPVESPPALDDGTIVAIFYNADTAGIETGKLAAKRGHRKEVRQFGAMLARDHAPGIGVQLDGWPNHELNPGAVIALSPALTAERKAVYNSWGPGKYDPRFNFDGQNGPQVIPPAYGLLGINKITVTGDGDDVAYWNRYVGVTQMHAHGSFSEPRLGITVNNPPDMISSKPGALQAYQLSLSAPPPPSGSFDQARVAQGQQCATCHAGPGFTDANIRLHPPADVVSEPEPNGAPSYASRSATKMYRTAPLRGIWQHPPNFHNGIAAMLDAVELYDSRKGLNLTADQKADLVEYLKSP